MKCPYCGVEISDTASFCPTCGQRLSSASKTSEACEGGDVLRFKELPRMSMGCAIKSVFSKYATFSGRARRSEFWFFNLFTCILSAALCGAWFLMLGPSFFDMNLTYSVDVLLGSSFSIILLLLVHVIVFFVPTLAVSVRRLHDTGRSGWWMLLCIINIGSIVVLVFSLFDSERGANRYGDSPKYVAE